mmetsp:Transcript_5677/g.6742  ORF Transcript_5677/g.6742 Transcript_5677/m.6742 type:complete len:558 (+) Transcript_5677:5690-7363(+)
MALKLFSKTNTMGLRGRRLRVMFTMVATLGFSLFGYDQGLMSGIITGDDFSKEFPAVTNEGAGSEHWATVNQGGITSCYEIGCFFGALFALFRGDRFGRRPMVIIGSLLIILGTIISTAAFGPHWGLGQFIIGRVITGLGNGMDTATIPVWQSEISKAENRGLLVNLEGSMVAVGTFIAYWLDFGLSYVNTSVQWRFPVAFQIVFALFLFLGVAQLPESPRWLIAHDLKDDARNILAALNDVDVDDEFVIEESVVISDAINRLSRSQLGFKELLSGGKQQNFARMIIGASTQFFQQFTGCNASIYYSTVLFENSIGLTGKLPLILGGVFATIYALSTIPSFFLIDRLGRRALFLIGAAGQGVAMTIAFASLIKDDGNDKGGQKAAAFGIFLFIAFFAFTILPLPWVYPPEINPLRTRTVASAVSTCTNWLTNFAVVMFTPLFMAESQFGCYLFFALFNYLFIPVIFFFYPETAGRTLEEIDIIFAKAHVDKRQPWRVAATMPHLSLREQEEEGNKLGLFDDFEKEGFEQSENISSNSSNKSPEEGSNDEPLVKPAEV